MLVAPRQLEGKAAAAPFTGATPVVFAPLQNLTPCCFAYAAVVQVLQVTQKCLFRRYRE